MKVRMGQSVFVHVSEDIVDKGTLQYHEDMRTAREIVSLLKKCRAKAQHRKHKQAGNRKAVIHAQMRV